MSYDGAPKIVRPRPRPLRPVEGTPVVQPVPQSVKIPEPPRLPEVARTPEPLSRLERFRQQFGSPLPPEYAARVLGAEITPEVLKKWYDVFELADGGAAFVDTSRLIGVAIDHAATGADQTMLRTVAFHRFTDEERKLLQSTASNHGPVSFGRPRIESQSSGERRIELLPTDVMEGDFNTISDDHLQFGGHDGRSVVADRSTFHGGQLVFEKPSQPSNSEARLHTREFFPKRLVTFNQAEHLGQRAKEDVARCAHHMLSHFDLPHSPEQFNWRLNHSLSEQSMTREKVHAMLDLLRQHQFEATASTLLKDTEVRRERLVRSLEIALNPLLAFSDVSSGRKETWELQAKDPQQQRALQDLLSIYRANAADIESTQEPGNYQIDARGITGDQGLRDRYKEISTVSYVTEAEGKQARQQFFEAYHRWLKNAIRNLEGVSSRSI